MRSYFPVPGNVLKSLATVGCSDSRGLNDRYGVGLNSKILKRLDRDHHQRRGLSFTGQTMIQPGALAGGALLFANPETLVKFKRDSMSHNDVERRIADLDAHRRISYEPIETLFVAKGVRDLVLTVHMDCAKVREKLRGHETHDEEVAFLQQVLQEATAFFLSRRDDINVYSYIIYLDANKTWISHLQDMGATLAEDGQRTASVA